MRIQARALNGAFRGGASKADRLLCEVSQAGGKRSQNVLYALVVTSLIVIGLVGVLPFLYSCWLLTMVIFGRSALVVSLCLTGRVWAVMVRIVTPIVALLRPY